MAIMVDLNQGWRMAGDTTPVARSRRRPGAIAARLAELDVLWVEEPLTGTDLRGLAALRAAAPGIADRRRRDDADVRRDAGRAWTPTRSTSTSPTSSWPPACSGPGRSAELALARNRWFTPHTWTNGLGLLANLHVAAGVGGGPFIEFPYDPPGWTPERRDAFLAEPIRPDADGMLRVPARARARRRPRRGGDRAVRGMTAARRAQPSDARRLDRPARPRSRPRTEAFIDGRFVPAASGRTFDDVAGRDGSVDRRRRRGRRRGRRPGGRRRAARRSTIGAGRTARRPTARASCSGSPS